VEHKGGLLLDPDYGRNPTSQEASGWRKLTGIGMKPEVIVRLAGPSDARSVTALLLELGCTVEGSQVRDRLSRLEGSTSDRAFLAEIDSRAVGLLGMHIAPLLHRDSFGRITALIVTQEHRGHGIGSRLLSAGEEWALSQGCTQIELNSGDQHAPAHAFYESHGYHSDDRRFVKEDLG